MQSLSTSVNVMNVIYPQLESVARNQPEEQRKYSVMLEGAGSHLVRKVRGAESNFTPADLEKLSDRQLRHILIFQRDLQRSYGKWKRWYARYCKERPAVSEETRIALRNVVADMKDSLDRVVAFLQEAHLDIEDHYAIFRSIVQAEAEASYGRRS